MTRKYNHNVYYWQERKDGFHKPFGKRRGIESLIKAIKIYNGQNTLKILDIGCGEGHIIKYLSENLNTKIEFYGLDRDPEILSNAKDIVGSGNSLHSFYFIQKNIQDKQWADDLEEFDIVLSVNTFHEIYSELVSKNIPSIERTFLDILKPLFSIVKKGGLLLLFDGLEQESAMMRTVEFKILNQDTFAKFQQFINEYKAFPISFNKLSDNSIKCNLFDFTRFITKLRFIDTPTWEIEKYESYQYFTESEFKALFNDNDMAIIDCSQFICDISLWQKNIEILNNCPFPEECFYILGRKR